MAMILRLRVPLSSHFPDSIFIVLASRSTDVGLSPLPRPTGNLQELGIALRGTAVELKCETIRVTTFGDRNGIWSRPTRASRDNDASRIFSYPHILRRVDSIVWRFAQHEELLLRGSSSD